MPVLFTLTGWRPARRGRRLLRGKDNAMKAKRDAESGNRRHDEDAGAGAVRVVRKTPRRLLVVAGAGSGKTETDVDGVWHCLDLTPASILGGYRRPRRAGRPPAPTYPPAVAWCLE